METNDLVERPCDVCGLPLKRHDRSAGIPICPGIYAPGYRSTLRDEIAALQARVAVLEGALVSARSSMKLAMMQLQSYGDTEEGVTGAYTDLKVAVDLLSERVEARAALSPAHQEGQGHDG